METQHVVLGIAGLIGIVVLFAQLKLFSIDSKLGRAVEQLEKMSKATEKRP